jgi:hypothetical protein
VDLGNPKETSAEGASFQVSLPDENGGPSGLAFLKRNPRPYGRGY